MQLELPFAMEGDQHRHRDAAARAPVETGTRPDLAPGVAREQILELLGQRCPRGLYAIDVLVPQHSTTHLHPAPLFSSHVNSSGLWSEGKEHRLGFALHPDVEMQHGSFGLRDQRMKTSRFDEIEDAVPPVRGVLVGKVHSRCEMPEQASRGDRHIQMWGLVTGSRSGGWLHDRG